MSTRGVPEGPGPPERPHINHDDDMITDSPVPEPQISNNSATNQDVDLTTNETNSQQQQSEINPSIKVRISINKY